MSEYVPVYVAVEHLPEVHSFVAALLSPAPAIVDADDREWPEDVLERLYFDAAESTRDVLVALARRPGEWLTADELAAAFGPDAGWRVVAAALSPLTKRMKRYGRRTWPFEVRLDPKSGRYSYLMSQRTAAIIGRIHDRVSAVIDGIRGQVPSGPSADATSATRERPSDAGPAGDTTTRA